MRIQTVRPPGSKNRHPVPRHDVGKTTRPELTLKHRANEHVKRQAKPARHGLTCDQSHSILGFASGWSWRD